MMIQIKKYKPIKLDLFYNDKLLGVIDNEVEFLQSRIDVMESGEYDKYYWKISTSNHPSRLLEIPREEIQNMIYTIDKYGVLNDWDDIYNQKLILAKLISYNRYNLRIQEINEK